MRYLRRDESLNLIELEGKLYVLTLDRGVDVLKGIEEAFLSSGWSEAIVLNAIGSVERAVVSYPEDSSFPPKVLKSVYEGPFEVCSLVGTISKRDGVPFSHLHVSLTNRGEKFYGGGLQEGSLVYRSFQIFIIAK